MELVPSSLPSPKKELVPSSLPFQVPFTFCKIYRGCKDRQKFDASELIFADNMGIKIQIVNLGHMVMKFQFLTVNFVTFGEKIQV